MFGKKKSTRHENEKPQTELKTTERFTTRDLDERLIAEVAKRVGGVRGYYLSSRTTDAMEGIVKTLFTPEIEREERLKDFNL